MFKNQLSETDVLRMLASWLEENEPGVTPRYGYSGRGMFGERCFGLEGSVNGIQAALMGFAADHPQTMDIVRKLVKNQRQDNMGTDMIVYFPGVDIAATDAIPAPPEASGCETPDGDRPRECSGALREEVFRRKGLHRDGNEPFDAWQAVLDIGFEWWQGQPKDSRIGYADMIGHMRKEYGEMSVLLILLGKANQQICNGGVLQYFDNGYASAGARGCMSEKTDIDLHEELVCLYGKHVRGYGKKTDAVHRLLKDIGKRLSGHLDELAEHSEAQDEDGENDEPCLDADDLDTRWYSDDLDVEESMRGLVDEIFNLEKGADDGQ